jgi:hypothetical protein
MGPKRKSGTAGTVTGVKTMRTSSPTPPLIESEESSDSDSDATNISLDEGSQTPLLIESDEEGSEKEADEVDVFAEEEEAEEGSEKEEEGLSQEEEDFLSQDLFQGNEEAEIEAINGVVDEVVDEVEKSQSQAELSQSQSELSQSQSQEIIRAIESNNCGDSEDVAKEVQDLENRLINPTNAEDRIAQLYLELLRSTGANIHEMLENLKVAIQTMMISTTATAMFEQINDRVVPLVRTVATTCVGYYLGSYLLRYVGGIISYLLHSHTTITLISLGSAGVHIVYNVGTREGAALLDQAVAAVNANIEIFLAGVNRISNITESTRQIMRESTLNAVRANVELAIAEVRGEYQETEMANIMSQIENLTPNDSEFQGKITEIQHRLNKLMAPVEVAGNNDDEEHFGGKRVKRNRTKKTKAKKTVKRKAKKVKKAKKAKKAKKTKKAKST